MSNFEQQCKVISDMNNTDIKLFSGLIGFVIGALIGISISAINHYESVVEINKENQREIQIETLKAYKEGVKDGNVR